jgi:predicted dehydrogenase
MDYEMWVGPAPFQPYNPEKVHYNWHWQREYGTGEMGNWGAHWLDVCRWFAGVDYPNAASGQGGQFLVDDIKEWPDTQTVVYEFPKLTMLWEQRIWTGYGINGKRSGSEVGGDKGSIVIDRGGWTFYPKDGDPVEHHGSELNVAHAVSFAEAIRGDGPSTAPIEEGYKSAVLCHLGNIVATVGRRVEFDATSQRIVNDEEASALEDRAYRAPWNKKV